MGRQYRLTRQEIAEIIKTGGFSSHKYFSVRRQVSNKGLKMAIITPKKVFKLAVARNKARRRFASAFRTTIGLNPKNIGFKFVFFLKLPCLSDQIGEISKDISKLFA